MECNKTKTNHSSEQTAAQRITIEILRGQYHRPLKEVAQSFGISTTLLKQICRKKGISRWPHRQIRSIDKTIEDLTKKEKKAVGPELAELKTAINGNQLKRKLVIDSCSWDLNARMRNAIFSYKAEDLNEFKLSQVYEALQPMGNSAPENESSQETQEENFALQNMSNLNIQKNAQFSEERQQYSSSQNTPGMYFQPLRSDLGCSNPYTPQQLNQFLSICNAYPTQTFTPSFPTGTIRPMLDSSNHFFSRGIVGSPFPAPLFSHQNILPDHLGCNPHTTFLSFPRIQPERASSKHLMPAQALQTLASAHTHPDFCTTFRQGANNRSTDYSFTPHQNLTEVQTLRIERELNGKSRICDTEFSYFQWNAQTLTETERARYNHKRTRLT